MKNVLMNTDVTLYGIKVIGICASYIAANICANYMGQVYMDKVLINQENPQPLVNFVYLFVILNVILNGIIAIILFLSLNILKLDSNTIMKMYMIDTVFFLAIVNIVGYIIASVMNNKKYFMYKEDGLRAIRALKEIYVNLSILFGVVPFFMIVKSFSSK